MKKVLLIDNFDSFTFNLKALTEASGNVTVDVVRNNRVTNELVENYNYLMLSPGPGLPAQAGRMPEILNYIIGKKPVLGICLGHQAIVEALGGKLLNLTRPLHGIATEIHTIAGWQTTPASQGTLGLSRTIPMVLLWELKIYQG
jgi:anthranilate synthase component II